MFRSLPMTYFQLVMPRESAWAIMNELGYLGCIQIIDHDESIPLIARPFANYVKRCDDLLLKLDTFYKQADKFRIQIPQHDIEIFLQQSRQNQSHTTLDIVEDEINKRSQHLQEQLSHYDQLLEQAVHTRDYMLLLHEMRQYFGLGMNQRERTFEYIVGVVKQRDLVQFQRIVFRITKGNAMMHTKIIEARGDSEEVKEIFIVLFQSAFKNKLKRLCDNMQSGSYMVPSTTSEMEQKINELNSKDAEIAQLLSLTYNQLLNGLRAVALRIGSLKMFLQKERELYIQMNKLRMQGALFLGELWVAQQDIQTVESALMQNQQRAQIGQRPFPHGVVIPTLFKVNDFTDPFQQIVNTYGVPRYQEANPAYLTCITFPFLFGVMFGDIGHGTVLTSLGVYLCFFQTEFKQFRYLILLMGLFSLYAGLIYNDFIGIPLDFGSCYLFEGELVETKAPGCYYNFGIDPAWAETLEFGDSVKMKFSVIVAYLHMSMGIILSATNYLHEKDYLRLFCKFVPQMLFLTCTFGYMDFLIVYKWIVSPQAAPSIINTMISMVLDFGRVDGEAMWDQNSQELVQLILLMIAFISVPWMWLPEIIVAMTSSHKGYGRLVEEAQEIQMSEVTGMNTSLESLDSPQGSLLEQPIHREETSEIIVHETIETIEFVLGAISNTASYLRLWALSLAHSQLSDVFFSLILSGAIKEGHSFNLILAYPIWALITLGVLLCMDTMECFLHSLRLHWVEFQSKFYKGDGRYFEVYKFKHQSS